jgi:hypothetical protein
VPIPEFLSALRRARQRTPPREAADACAESGTVILHQALANHDLRYLHLYCTALFRPHARHRHCCHRID